MSKFVVNEDMFGRYCEIKTDFSENMHTYKIVALIESNSYCDVPLYWNSEPTLHKDVVPVLLVIHCGIDETKVQRVALSDCEVQPTAEIAEGKPGHWVYNRGQAFGEPCYFCSLCIDGGSDYGLDNYCPNCGAKMDGEREDEE